MIKVTSRFLQAALLAIGFALNSWESVDAAPALNANQLMISAEVALQHFMDDPEMAGFRSIARHAKGVFIAPKVWEGGIGIGGSSGRGVLFIRDKASGEWLGPAFYSMNSASLGIQFGLQKSEVVLLVMTENGFNAMLTSGLKLGAGASVALGPVGQGNAVSTADILAFSRSKGVYGGLMVNGQVLAINRELNLAYYGSPLDSVDILVRNSAPTTDQSFALKALVARLTEGS